MASSTWLKERSLPLIESLSKGYGSRTLNNPSSRAVQPELNEVEESEAELNYYQQKIQDTRQNIELQNKQKYI